MRYPRIFLVPALLLAVQLPAQQPALIKDIHPTRGSFPLDFHRHEGLVFFTANDGKHGRELWRTDGTASGTFMVQDTRTGITSSDVRELTSLGKLLLFHTTDGQNGRDLWATEGTAASTRSLTKIHLAETIHPVALGDVALFRGRASATTSPSLWRTDGTPKGTFEIKMSKPLVAFSNGIVFRGRVYFAGGNIASNNTPDVELWVTDGTANGTRLVKDVLPGSGSSAYSSFPQDFVIMGGALYFHARSTGVLGPRLWRTDGTAKGTLLVNQVSPISAFHGPHDLLASGSKLFFGLNSRLWVSDGTPKGTRALGPTFQNPRFGPIAEFHGGVLFTASTVGGGAEIWGSNGVSIGTTDIEPGAASSNPGDYARIGVRNLLFSAFTGKNGYELWVVGPDLKPRLLHDLNPAAVSQNSGSSSPYGFTLLNGRVVFAADNGKAGHELWSVFPGATSQRFGRGCGPVGRVPGLLSSGDPVLGQPNTYSLVGAPVSAPGLLLLGLPAVPSAGFPGACRLYPALNGMIPLPLQTQGNGSASLMVSTPNQSALQGLTAALQAVVAAGSSQVAFSNALHLTPGR